MTLRYLHTMVRVKDLDKSMAFFRLLGLEETKRMENEEGRFTLVFMAPPGQEDTPVELTYNWDGDDALPSDSRHFGHLAYRTDDIYALCQKLMDAGVTINRPPRDGHMAFVRSPDNISVELLQDGYLDPQEPWASMENTGHWLDARWAGNCDRDWSYGSDFRRLAGAWTERWPARQCAARHRAGPDCIGPSTRAAAGGRAPCPGIARGSRRDHCGGADAGGRHHDL